MIRFGSGILVLIVLLAQLVYAQDKQKEGAQESSGVQGSHRSPRVMEKVGPDACLADADDMQRQGRNHLREAVRQSSKELASTANQEYQVARKRYVDCAQGSVGSENRVPIIRRATVGLVESGYPLDALTLILEFPNAAEDATIVHVKADVLWSIGESEASALAYENWMTKGKCNGEYALPYSVPQYGDLAGWQVIPTKSLKDPCSHLPSELRYRLEALSRRYGHPKTLPLKNYPPMPEE